MYWSILHRTIFMELLRVFLLALVALTSLVLLAGIVAEASRNGLGPGQILTAIPLLIPSMLPYTLPATALFATCVVYGRLAADNEILAMKAAGIHLNHVVWPALLLGGVTSAVTMGLYFDIIPTTHHELRTRFVSDVEELLYGMLRREGCIRHGKINYNIFVKRVEGKKLHDATFMRRDPKGLNFDVIARAREATLSVDMAHNQIIVHMQHCYVSSNDSDEAYVQDKKWPVEIPDDIVPKKNSQRAMTWPELFEHLEKTHADLEQIDAQIAVHQARINQATAPSHWTEHVRNLLFQKQHLEQQINLDHLELHMRPALALGCLCFMLVGCPVGIWFSRSDYLSAFITCFLPIVVIYYPLLLCGINLVKSGKLGPILAVWTANGLMALIALGLYRKLLRN